MAAEKKLKKRYHLAPCPNYDVEKLESWLQDMAKEGWQLEKDSIFCGFFTFAKAAPSTVRYRLEPKGKDDSLGDVPDEDLRSLCEEYGWEYVDSYGQFYIYRATRPDAREMNTDLQVQAAALKTGTLSSGIITLIDGILLVNILTDSLGSIFRSLVTLGLFYHLVIWTFYIWSIIDVTLQGIHIRRLRKQLKANIPLDHNKSWKKGAAFHRFSKIAYVLLIFLIFGVIFGSCVNAVDEAFIDNTQFPGDPPFVTFADMRPEGEFTPKSFLSEFNQYVTHSNFFAPQIIEWKEYGVLTTPGGDTIEGSLLITYYETISPLLARGVLEDYLRDAEDDRHFFQLEAPDIDTDCVVAYNAIYPTILIQHGNVFIHAQVPLELNGERILLDEWAQLMAEMLTRE